VLLLIDVDQVKSPIKYEGALSGRAGTFPHIYGPLNINVVYATLPFAKDEKGKFILPTQLKQFEQTDEFKKVVNIMTNTPPISNVELIKRNRERKG
jgi:hypothetical protein